MSNIRKHKPMSPSDFSLFALTVHNASASLMDFETYFEVYEEVLRILFWNYDIDTDIALNRNIEKKDLNS